MNWNFKKDTPYFVYEPEGDGFTYFATIEDRDLWRFALPGTREIQANVFSYPYDFDIWDELMATDSIVTSTNRLVHRVVHSLTLSGLALNGRPALAGPPGLSSYARSTTNDIA